MGISLPNKRSSWWPLALIVFAQGLVLALSPGERTLGAGIKPVYLHVSITWVGMLLLLVCGLLGLAVAITGHERLTAWLAVLSKAAFGLYGLGFLVSMVASYVNWGGVPLREPRVLTALNVLAAAAFGLVLTNWLPQRRLKGLLGTLPAGVMVFSVTSSRMVLHPDSPVSTSPLGIRSTFYGMFFLALLFGGWWIYYFSNKQGH